MEDYQNYQKAVKALARADRTLVPLVKINHYEGSDPARGDEEVIVAVRDDDTISPILTYNDQYDGPGWDYVVAEWNGQEWDYIKEV